MDVTSALLRFASGRPHALLLETPGGTAARLAVEVELRRRGWPAAASPAQADIVVLVGPSGTQLMPMVGRVWWQVPKPRVFVHADSAAAVSQLLDEGRRRLAAGGETGEVFAGEKQEGGESHEEHHGGSDYGDDTHEGTGTGEDVHGSAHGGEGEQGGGDGHGGHDHGGHAHHHGGGAEMPGGVGMAERGPDRDGLQLDQLHVPLGPLLPDWSPGLVVHTTLQGDVVQRARVDVVPENGAGEDFWNEPSRRAAAGQAVTRGERARRHVGAYLDCLARLLRVAGWPDPATGAGRLRDEVLAGARAEQVTPGWRRLTRHLHRARTLRWLTDGLGVLPPDRAEAAGFAGAVLRASRDSGDVTARWQAWLDEIERVLPHIDHAAALPAGNEGPREEDWRSEPARAVLPELLEGAELAAVRLIVASLDPAVTTVDGRAATEVTRG